jgi:hypothetical protein
MNKIASFWFFEYIIEKKYYIENQLYIILEIIFDISLTKKKYFRIKSNNQKIIHFYIRERINFKMKNKLNMFFFPDKFEIYKKIKFDFNIWKNLRIILYLLNNLEWNRFFFAMKYKKIFSRKMLNYFF